MLPDDLPEDMPSFLARFGTDEQCREYLFKARWPDGFRCAACGHDDAYALRTKIVYECAACRKQHSLLAGTIFEQTKTGLAKWFLAIYLVTSSKGGIAATELRRQLGLGSYQTAWTWLHKLRKAMVRPGPRAPGRARRGRRDLRRRPEARQARPGRRRQDPGRRGGRGRPRRGPRPPPRPAPARPAGRRLGREPGRLPRRQRRQAGDRGHRRLARLPRPAGQGLRPRAGQHQRLPGRRRAPAARASTWCSASSSAGSSAPTTARWARSTSPPTSTSTRSASTAAPPSGSATASPASSSTPCASSLPATEISSLRQHQPDGHG